MGVRARATWNEASWYPTRTTALDGRYSVSPRTLAKATVVGLGGGSGGPGLVVATGDGVPAPAGAVVRVGYHEASFHVALALTPMGRCLRDYNRTKFAEPPHPRAGLPGPVVRGRGTPATTAADVAMPLGTIVLAPVTGVITSAKPYRLYGRYFDIRIAIRPDHTNRIEVVVEP